MVGSNIGETSDHPADKAPWGWGGRAEGSRLKATHHCACFLSTSSLFLISTSAYIVHDSTSTSTSENFSSRHSGEWRREGKGPNSSSLGTLSTRPCVWHEAYFLLPNFWLFEPRPLPVRLP